MQVKASSNATIVFLLHGNPDGHLDSDADADGRSDGAEMGKPLTAGSIETPRGGASLISEYHHTSTYRHATTHAPLLLSLSTIR